MEIDFVSLLQLLFIALKLKGFIDWPWWLVLSPYIFGFLVIVLPIFLVGSII